jgi:YVTN family beta-propeller protein
MFGPYVNFKEGCRPMRILLRLAVIRILLTIASLAFPLASYARPFAYVTNVASGTVSVIDTSDGTVVDTIRVGEGPAGVAITPDGTHAYVTNGEDGTVSVIDTSNNTVVDTVRVGRVPLGLAITPDGGRVYVAHRNLEGKGIVSVIDTSNNTARQDERIATHLGSVFCAVALPFSRSLLHHASPNSGKSGDTFDDKSA